MEQREKIIQAMNGNMWVKNAGPDLAFFQKNYAHKIRLLDAKGDSTVISVSGVDYKITRTGFDEDGYKVEKV